MLSKSQEKLIEQRRKKRIAAGSVPEYPVNPIIKQDYVPYRFSTIKDFFKSGHCISKPKQFQNSGVYFLTYVGDESKIKIGKGKCIATRLRSYLTHHYRDIKVLCMVHSPNNFEGILEKDFHDFFFKIRYDREWYTSTDFLLNSIEEIKQINNFMPFIIPRQGQDIYEDPNYFYNEMSKYCYEQPLH